MPVHPQIKLALEALVKANLPPIQTLTASKAREVMNAMSKARGGEPAPVAKTENRTVPGPRGDVPVRIHWPKAKGPHPVFVYFHGGGFVIGDIDTHDTIARNICGGADVVVVSVDYRLAPEHKFPAAAEDAWAGYQWVRSAPSGLDIDASRIAIGGDSAGANLAAVVALMARDAGHDNIRLQLLVYPVTDFAMTSASYGTYADGFGVLTADAMKWFGDHYLARAEDAADWRASPIKADLKGLPPALIIAAECDVLRDEGLAYAEALRAAGNAVERKEYAGMIHGFFGMTPVIDDAVGAQHHAIAALKRALS
ncbi:MAG: alpha/beta hydrolase [Hyphomicrobiaceae bacterium]